MWPYLAKWRQQGDDEGCDGWKSLVACDCYDAVFLCFLFFTTLNFYIVVVRGVDNQLRRERETAVDRERLFTKCSKIY
eukprot:scaffold362_cov176-Amphora_coffeaeformis.AAC.29